MSIRVILADDHHLVRLGLRCLLDKEQGLQVVDEAVDGQDAIDAAARVRPDVVVMDIKMPVVDGIEAMGRIRDAHSETRVVMLSMYSETALIRKAFDNGASGFVCKNSTAEELVQAIRIAYRGGTHRPKKLKRVDPTLYPDLDDPRSRLTVRERQILRLIASGQTNRQVSETLSISIKTVEHHRNNLMGKLNSHSLAALIHAAIGLGLIDQ